MVDMSSDASGSSSPPELAISSSFLLPYDLVLIIVSFLEASDVCSLGSCSRFWRVLCASDGVWAVLYMRRWPSSAAADLAASSLQDRRALYINKHKEMSNAASSIIRFVEQWSQHGSLEVGFYLRAISDLRSMQLGFKDIQLFLLGIEHNVLLNLIGLHYCLFWLDIQPNDLMDLLETLHLSERQVCVSWFKVGRWFYGFRLPDEHRSRTLSLGDFTMAKEEEVLRVLNRGVIHEVLRVHIKSVGKSAYHIMRSGH